MLEICLKNSLFSYKQLIDYLEIFWILNIPCFPCPCVPDDSFSTFPMIFCFYKFILMYSNTYAFSILKYQILACYSHDKIIWGLPWRPASNSCWRCSHLHNFLERYFPPSECKGKTLHAETCKDFATLQYLSC